MSAVKRRQELDGELERSADACQGQDVSLFLRDAVIPVPFVEVFKEHHKGGEVCVVVISYYLDNDPEAAILHRENGPARVCKYYWGRQLYWLDHGVLHRENDEPASIVAQEDGTVLCESWIDHGRLHRESAPAYRRYHADGSLRTQEWWVDDCQVEPPMNSA